MLSASNVWNVTTIGTIGAGNIGAAIAKLAEGTEHRVILSNSRGPASLSGLAMNLGQHVSAGITEDAASCDIVVVTIPLHKLSQLPNGLLNGKVLIDTMNYYPDRDGAFAELDRQETTTSRMVAEHFHGARVVKAFSSIVFSHLIDLARPTDAADRSTLPVAADDQEAKALVASLVRDFGFDVLDAGSLANSWRFENGQPAYCLPYVADPQAWRASSPGNRTHGTRRVTGTDLADHLARGTRA